MRLKLLRQGRVGDVGDSDRRLELSRRIWPSSGCCRSDDSLLSGIELTTTIESNPVIPNWLGESILLGKYWIESGVL